MSQVLRRPDYDDISQNDSNTDVTGSELEELSDGSETSLHSHAGGGGSGDVTGPASSTDNAVARFDGTGGKTIQNSGVTIDDSDNVSGVVNSAMTGYLDISEISTPADPSANTLRLYAQDEGGFSVLHKDDENGIDTEIGRDTLHVVRNTTGATLSKGEVVYISGSNGTYPTVALADASDSTKMPAFGLVVADIANNSFGQVIQEGDLGGLDTSSFSDGQVVFVSASTAGALTATEPTGTDIDQRVGVVIKGGTAGAGIIEVDTGGEVDPALTQTLTNKTIDTANNTLTVVEADISDLQSYLLNVVEDTTPQLGGTLDVNGNLIDFNGLADGLVLDADGDTTISAPTDDQIDFEVGGSDLLQISSSSARFEGIDISVAGSVSGLLSLSNTGEIAAADGSALGLSSVNGVTIDGGSGSLFGVFINGSSTEAASIKMREDTDNGTNHIKLIAPASIAANYTVTLPSSAGTVELEGHTHTESDITDLGSYIGGSTGGTDNRVLRADGTGGSTLQSSATTIDDSGNLTSATLQASGANGNFQMTADTDGGQFNLLTSASGTLAIYGSASATLDVNILDGDLTMTAGNIDMNGNDIIIDADGDTKIEGGTDDRISFTFASSEAAHISSSGVVTPTGKAVLTDTISEYTTAGGVTIDGVLIKDSRIDHDYLQIGNADIGISGIIGDNELLAYDNASGEWINQTADEADIVDKTSSQTLTNKDMSSTTNTPMAVPWTRVKRVVPTGSRTVTSSSYVDIPTDTVVLSNLTKVRDDSNLVIHIDSTFYMTGGNALVEYGVNFNSTDYDVALLYSNATSVHRQVSGTREISGISAGTYTFTLRIKRNANTVNINTDDINILTVSEVMPG